MKLYASGERPFIGDVVRRDVGRWLDVKAGDVVVVRDHSAVELKLDQGVVTAGYDIQNFTLIARAGDPVTFQPGDVVECVSGGVDKGGGGTGRVANAGDRRTVSRIVSALNSFAPQGYFYTDDEDCKGYRSHCFRLVHRPAAPAAVEPEPAPTTAEIAATLRHGDRVRYVIETTVDLSERTDNALDYWLFDDADVMAGTIEILSRAAPCPAPGKLSSTDDLLPGDILVCTTPGLGLFGEQVTVKRVDSASLIRTSEGLYHPSHFAFVRRPV